MRTTDTPGWLAGAAGVDLVTLQAQASWQTRTDRKYLLLEADVQRILDPVAGEARVLEIDGQRSFGYASVYFDTAELRSYHQTATRRRRRSKVRTRTYLDSGQRWLEVKTAGGRGLTVKQRRPLDSTDAARLTADDLAFVSHALGPGPATSGELALTPALTTGYRRSTLLLPADGVRVTLDTALQWRQPDGPALSAPALAVLETKGTASASSVDRLLWAAGHRPRALSKYATGLALLRPDLRANRWHRTLHEITAHAA